LFSIVISAQSYSISGTIDDFEENMLEGVKVLVEDLDIETVTDKNGNFEISDLPKGVHTLVISFKGFRSKKQVVYLKSEQLVKNFTIKEDLLDLHRPIDVGVITPISNLSSSTAVTTIKAAEIAFKTSRSTAAILSNVPGFSVESTAGVSGNNLFSRGMTSGAIFSPASLAFDNPSKTAGAFEFVQLQEDGLPIFEDGALAYAGADVFSRIDLTIDNIQSLRGGSSSVAVSGSPGGVVNIISKTGQNELEGVAKVTTSDYRLFRYDSNFSGAIIKDKLFFNVGGFYRVDQGIRVTDFNANNGGQIKANFNYLFEKGAATVYLKYLNDKNTLFNAVPLVYNNGSLQAFTGFNANFGTFSTSSLNNLSIPQSNGVFEADLTNGSHPKSFAAGSTFKINPIKELKIENSFKFTRNKLTLNGIFAPHDFGGVLSQADFASQEGVSNSRFSFVSNNQTLNSNIPLLEVDYRYVDREMSNFANKLKFDFEIDRYSLLSGGYYFSTWESEQFTDVSSLLVTATDRSQLVNLRNNSNGDGYTSGGISSISFEKSYAQTNNTIHALFGDFESELTDHLKLDLGIRFDLHDYRGVADNGTPQDLGIANNSTDDETRALLGNFVGWEYDFTELSYSAGLNYMFDTDKAAFIHFSRGFRAPTEETLYYYAVDKGSGLGTNGLRGIRPISLIQIEGGYKYSTPNLAFAANLFYLNMGNIIYQPGTTATQQYGNIVNTGLELEAAYKFDKFKAVFNGTVQNPRYSNFNFINTGTTVNPTGNIVRRTPIYHFGLTPNYRVNKDFNLFVTWSSVGESYNDQSNSFKIPSYNEFNLGGTYKIERFLIGLDITNLLNSYGITEVTGQEIGQAPLNSSTFLGRPLLGRAARLALTYHIDEDLLKQPKKASF
jgi:outer membrane receptor protein involved in Fe transport